MRNHGEWWIMNLRSKGKKEEGGGKTHTQQENQTQSKEKGTFNEFE